MSSGGIGAGAYKVLGQAVRATAKGADAVLDTIGKVEGALGTGIYEAVRGVAEPILNASDSADKVEKGTATLADRVKIAAATPIVFAGGLAMLAGFGAAESRLAQPGGPVTRLVAGAVGMAAGAAGGFAIGVPAGVIIAFGET